MKLSIHATLQGKPSRNERGWFEQNGKSLNLGDDWVSIDAEWDDVFKLMTEDGCAIAPYLTRTKRNEENFVEHSLALVDIDFGMTVDQLESNTFYQVFGAGFYTTPSHTDENQRFRIIHRLEDPITNSDRMRSLYRALMLEYGCADASCKDASRLFYGTVGCLYKEQRSNTLPADIVDALINEIERQDAEEIRVIDQTPHAPLSDHRKQKIVALMRNSHIATYDLWRNIGWGMREGGFTLEDFIYATREPKSGNAKIVWDTYRAGSITMGTVIHFLKTRHGEDCLFEPAHLWTNRSIATIKIGGV